MKRDRTLEKTLYRHLGLFGMPSASQLDASRGRIRERLAHVETSPGEAAADVRPARPVHHMWRAGVSMAAACILLIVLVSTSRWPGADSLGSVAAADGSLYSLSGNTRRVLRQGDSIDASKVVHSNGGAGAMLALADGSRVEMRSQSELVAGTRGRRHEDSAALGQHHRERGEAAARPFVRADERHDGVGRRDDFSRER